MCNALYFKLLIYINFVTPIGGVEKRFNAKFPSLTNGFDMLWQSVQFLDAFFSGMQNVQSQTGIPYQCSPSQVEIGLKDFDRFIRRHD